MHPTCSVFQPTLTSVYHVTLETVLFDPGIKLVSFLQVVLWAHYFLHMFVKEKRYEVLRTR